MDPLHSHQPLPRSFAVQAAWPYRFLGAMALRTTGRGRNTLACGITVLYVHFMNTIQYMTADCGLQGRDA